MISILFSLLGVIPGLAEKFLDWQVKRANVEMEGFRYGTATDIEGFKAYLLAQVETNKIKLAANAWWGAQCIILIAGVPAALHMAAIFLDSMPFPFHTVGAWGIPKPPPPYDGYQRDIVLSFFIVMPVMTLTSAAAQWLNRGRR
jgi:hypothetical protein